MRGEYTESETKAQGPTRFDASEIAKRIDHTLLKPEATESQIKDLCREAREFGFFSVCVAPKWLKLTQRELAGSGVVSITVVGFPSGAETTSEKVQQATESVSWGAREIDMVLNRGLLGERRYDAVLEDIAAVVRASAVVPVKVILETSELSRDQITAGCVLSALAGAKWVKTSTGFASGGATTEDVRLMASIVGPRLGVKASGGIRNYETACEMLAAGATRLGTSASVAIIKRAESGEGGY